MLALAMQNSGLGWERNLSDVDQGVKTWDHTFGSKSAAATPAQPDGVPYVADGRRCEACRRKIEQTKAAVPVCPACYSAKGRGTTAIDKGRVRETGGLIRVDLVSEKTDKLTKTGGFPSKVEVSTGNDKTLAALVRAANDGAAIPTVIFVSADNPDGSPSEQGYALFLDIGALIRSQGVAVGKFTKGNAPSVWQRFGARRNCGATSRANAAAIKNGGDGEGTPVEPGHWCKRADWDFPTIDLTGRRWSKPWYVHYPQLFVNINKKHLAKHGLAWVACHVSEVPALVEAQEWGAMGTFW
jgi:hypothetical protein